MSDSRSTTNLLLLLILIALLAGFGFLIFAALVGLWLVILLIGGIFGVFSALFRAVDEAITAITKPISRFYRSHRSLCYWILTAASIFAPTAYILFTGDYSLGLMALAVFLGIIGAFAAFFGSISAWDSWRIKKKYAHQPDEPTADDKNDGED